MTVDTGLRDPENDETYTVREFRPDDLADVLALDRAVWNRDRGPEWFDWKYGENPYLGHVPVVVAEGADGIVGARPLLPFRIRVGGRVALALQPADTMVHPEHRQKGIFTRMNELAIDRYADEAAFFFNYPNEQALPGYLNLGWQVVGGRPTYYRVQNPVPLAETYGGDIGRKVSRLVKPLLDGYYRVRELLVDPPSDVRVERYDHLPLDLLCRLYEQRVPGRAHALRDRQFYRWRLSSPTWSRRTYVAFRDGSASAAVVARTRTTAAGVSVTQFAEVVPMTGGERWAGSLRRLFERTIRDHADSDLLSIADSDVPHELLSSFGFHRDNAEPLSRLSSRNTVSVVRALGDGTDGAPTMNGRDLSQEDSWVLSFVERDTA